MSLDSRHHVGLTRTPAKACGVNTQIMSVRGGRLMGKGPFGSTTPHWTRSWQVYPQRASERDSGKKRKRESGRESERESGIESERERDSRRGSAREREREREKVKREREIEREGWWREAGGAG